MKSVLKVFFHATGGRFAAKTFGWERGGAAELLQPLQRGVLVRTGADCHLLNHFDSV